MSDEKRAMELFAAAYEAYLTLPKAGFTLAHKALEPLGRLGIAEISAALASPPVDDPFFARAILLDVLNAARAARPGAVPVELLYPQVYGLYRMVTERPSVIAEYEKAVSLASRMKRHDEAYGSVASALARVQRLARSANAVESLIAPLYEDLGSLYIKSKMYPAAKTLLTSFRDLELFPVEMRVRAYHGLSDLAMIEKDAAGAVKILEDFRSRHPDVMAETVRGWLDDLIIHQISGVPGGESDEDGREGDPGA